MPTWLAKFILHLLGVNFVDKNDKKYPNKYILAVVTHTSNRDFSYGIYSRAMLNQDINFVGKSTLFKGLVGTYLRWMGGVPVVREKSTNFVDAVANIFEERDEFRLCIAIEGTRTKVDHFKTGFYFIALKAGVPIVPCKFDFGNNLIEFAEPYYPTGDIRKDFDFLYRYFDGAIGLVPENSFDYDPKVLDLLPEVKARD
jgi:1-acyl-sn-glycerol-3-phosphate acyltransferase